MYIRTKKPQLIDAQNRISEVVYFRILNRMEDAVKGTVIFDIEQSILVTSNYTQERAKTDENGHVLHEFIDNEDGTKSLSIKKYLVSIANTQLVRIPGKKETFPVDFFERNFNDLKQEDWYKALIAQIEWRNKQKPKPGQIQNYYWNLTASDLEFVSDEEMKSMLGEKILTQK